MSKEGDEEDGISRRTLLKGAAVAGAASLAGIGGYALVKSLSAPVEPFRIVRDTFLYAEVAGAELPAWWIEQDLVGKEALLSHFEPGRGANVLWRAEVDSLGQIIDIGFPALLIQVDENELEFPEGHPVEDFVIQGLMAVFDCCTHACCHPGWQLMPRSSFYQDPGHDTVYCPCHDSQYNPRRLFKYRHPAPPDASGAEYLGIYKEPGLGPANRGMPLIPLELEGDRIVGTVKNADWYQYLDFKRTVISEE